MSKQSRSNGDAGLYTQTTDNVGVAPRVLFVVSAAVDEAVTAQGPNQGPYKDYTAVTRSLHATVLDYAAVKRSGAGRLLARTLGMPVAQAWLAFSRRKAFDAFLTDGEHIGLPLAALLKVTGSRASHVTIGHRIAAPKKRALFRWLRLHTHIDRIAVHSRRQYELAVGRTGIPTNRVAFVPYQVDAEFWRPQPVPEERLICSAGLEYRDYPTLFQAVAGLDVSVIIGAASFWSRRRNTAADAAPPPNVSVEAFDYRALRQVYARAAVVVVPLQDVDFQAGITTILEAMAMGKPVVVTQSQGQTDAVIDGQAQTPGLSSPPRPESLLVDLAKLAGVALEPNGLYVPAGDPQSLRRAIEYLLDRPEERARLGAAGRRLVTQMMTVDQYAGRLRDLLLEACSAHAFRAVEVVPAGVHDATSRGTAPSGASTIGTDASASLSTGTSLR